MLRSETSCLLLKHLLLQSLGRCRTTQTYVSTSGLARSQITQHTATVALLAQACTERQPCSPAQLAQVAFYTPSAWCNCGLGLGRLPRAFPPWYRPYDLQDALVSNNAQPTGSHSRHTVYAAGSAACCRLSSHQHSISYSVAAPGQHHYGWRCMSLACDGHRQAAAANQNTIQLAGYSSQSAAISPPEPTTGAADPTRGFVHGNYNVSMFPVERIRNFSIIAHVDHGKSTLADRLMELTGAISKGSKAQYLDRLQVERDRGITVKAQTASLVYRFEGQDYLLNLIDTPGHVDFSYEVSRSLAACQGALLLVDGVQGIQAQTVANFYLAFELGLDLVPVVSKIDLAAAEPERVAQEMVQTFDARREDVVMCSAKTGQGMEHVLPAVIKNITPPRGSKDGPLRALLFDAYHDEYRGVICLVQECKLAHKLLIDDMSLQVVDGCLKQNDQVAMLSTGERYTVAEIGVLAPEPHATGRLLTGQVGYIVCGIRDLKAARVGDTMYSAGKPVEPLPGFKPAKSMVYAGLYPLSGDEYGGLCEAMDKLTLNDASVSVKKDRSEALGLGFRCGFLGMLHMEVFMQRLEQEYKAVVVTTTPTVPYIVHYVAIGSSKPEVVQIESAVDFQIDRKVMTILEPTVNATIVSPNQYIYKITELCRTRHGQMLEQTSLAGDRTLLRYSLPLAELASNFYSELKSRTQGYASFDYEEGEYRPADLQRLDILVHNKVVDALARMVHCDDILRHGKALIAKLAGALDKQLFDVAIQAAANGKIIARETVKAARKDVTAKCYGGDVSRKRKLLDRQKEGKKRLKRLGSVDIPQEVFPELMKL